MSKPTMESIIKKLGFDPLDPKVYGYGQECVEDDSKPDPLAGLTREELEVVYETALKEPRAWIKSSKEQ